MKKLVMKFGGASMAKPENFSHIADIILRRSEEYSQIAVVVSAMGDTTDQLLELARRVHPNPPTREQDMLISVGERISISLLAMALDLRDREAISFTGSQSGIITSTDHSNARIVEVKPFRLLSHLEKGKIVIVAGFQGVSLQGEITTLGRGGSDTSAVAIAVALQAEKVEFYKDVPGICEEDPKKNPRAKVFSRMTYEEALSVVASGSQVLSERCIVLAEKNQMPLHVLPFRDFIDNNHVNQIGSIIGTGMRKKTQNIFEGINSHDCEV